jgi:hypothetical protein
MSTSAQRVIAATAIAFVTTFNAGCQLKSAAVPANFITVDPATFVLHSVDRYQGQGLNGTDSTIVVVKATYTNPETNPEAISPDRFQLLDPSLMAVYYGLAGGDVNIPPMQNTTIAAGKSVDVTVGFRVPAAMTTARLVYRP